MCRVPHDVAAQARERQVEAVRGDRQVVEEAVGDSYVRGRRRADGRALLVGEPFRADVAHRGAVVCGEGLDAGTARLGFQQLTVGQDEKGVFIIREAVSVDPLS